MDALAFEPQFLEHIAPVWAELPDRGRLFVGPELADRAAAKGLPAEVIDHRDIRSRSLPPKARRGDGPIAFAASIGDIKVGRRLGYRRFVFIEHGIGQSYAGSRSGLTRHPSYAGGTDREDVELFLVPNEHSASMWRNAYSDARVEIVGCPRLDGLPRRVPAGQVTVCVSFHWPAFVAPESGTALGTFFGVLPELPKRFTVIGHGHPKGDWPKRMERVYRRSGIEFVPEFDDVLRRADVYVCDNSSSIYEFASTGRPVVLLNDRNYRKHVEHGLRFWEAADVGVQVDDPASLGDAIEEALRDAPERQAAREAALNIVYQPRTNGAAYAVTAINDWLASQRVAA